VTLVVNNRETFSWRHGILIDSGVLQGGSIFVVAWDGMGTLIDSSSGGTYKFQNNFTGSMSQMRHGCVRRYFVGQRALNDSITGTTNNRVMLTGNTSFNTNSSGRSVDLRGTGSMVYVGNFWDVPPTALLPIASN